MAGALAITALFYTPFGLASWPARAPDRDLGHLRLNLVCFCGQSCAAAGSGPERRAWLPHLTVIRFRERPGLKPSLPKLGPFVTSEAAVYMSVLRPAGAQYSVLESVGVGR